MCTGRNQGKISEVLEGNAKVKKLKGQDGMDRLPTEGEKLDDRVLDSIGLKIDRRRRKVLRRRKMIH